MKVRVNEHKLLMLEHPIIVQFSFLYLICPEKTLSQSATLCTSDKRLWACSRPTGLSIQSVVGPLAG